MKSKEEILFSGKFNANLYASVQLNTIFESMDEYSKEVAIGFLEWTSKEDYMRLSNTVGHKWFKIGKVPTFTTDGLFELYLKSKKKSNGSN